MNHGKATKPTQITDFFCFADPSHQKNNKNEETSNIDPNSGMKIYTLNTRQGIQKKIKDIMAELVRLNMDIATITKTGLNESNYRNQALSTTIAKNGSSLLSSLG